MVNGTRLPKSAAMPILKFGDFFVREVSAMSADWPLPPAQRCVCLLLLFFFSLVRDSDVWCVLLFWFLA
jgi:hypothetical protein